MGNTRIIKSLDRAIDLLELFRRSEGELSVTEISSEMQVSKSTIFGVLSTLLNRGYLHQNPDNKKYSLGYPLLELGELVRKNNIIAEKSRPLLKKLVDKYKETVHLAIEDNEEVIYIDKLMGEKTIYISSRIGSKNPIYSTGVGKCILAFMNPMKRNKIIENLSELKKYTDKTIVDKYKLQEELEIIAQRGYSIDDEEFVIGLYCYAVPILDKHNEAIASLSISGPTASIKSLNKEEVIESLTNSAREIAFQL